MSGRSKRLFLLLIAVQAAHSVEEYVTRLYDVFAPARFVSGLIGEDLATGFIVINAAVVALGIWCYLGPVRSGQGAGRVVAWSWLVVELVNGAGHILMAASTGGYFSGVLTGVALSATAVCLALSLIVDKGRPLGTAPRRIA